MFKKIDKFLAGFPSNFLDFFKIPISFISFKYF